jgi:hypothetical protein
MQPSQQQSPSPQSAQSAAYSEAMSSTAISGSGAGGADSSSISWLSAADSLKNIDASACMAIQPNASHAIQRMRIVSLPSQ